jgi:hypothetical protein
MGVRTESQEIAEGLHGDDGAGDGIWGYFLRQAVSADPGVSWMIFHRFLSSIYDKYQQASGNIREELGQCLR